jgi:hypothetical protein
VRRNDEVVALSSCVQKRAGGFEGCPWAKALDQLGLALSPI